MALINEHYNKLAAGYLFPEIARRTSAFQEAHPNANIIRMGIEMEQRTRRPKAYWINVSENPLYESFAFTSAVGGTYERIPAERIVHVFHSERMETSRGVPWMAQPLCPISSCWRHTYKMNVLPVVLLPQRWPRSLQTLVMNMPAVEQRTPTHRCHRWNLEALSNSLLDGR